MSLNERNRKTEAFMIGFGAISIPFGAILGALLANVGTRYLGSQPNLTLGQSVQLYSGIMAVCAFYLVVPVICVAIVRQWHPGLWWIGLAMVLIAVLALMTPTSEMGIPIVMWLTITSAWMTICFALAFLCRVMDVRKSFLK